MKKVEKFEKIDNPARVYQKCPLTEKTCIEQECAWYFPEIGFCALLDIAKCLHSMDSREHRAKNEAK